MRILFTTVALPGHFFPLVPLAWACRAAGHEVLALSGDEFLPTVLGSGLTAAGSGPAAAVDLVADDRPDHGLAAQRAAHGHAFGRMAAQALSATLAAVRDWRPDLVVSERAEFAGPLAAQAHAVQRAELHWGVAEMPEYRSAAAAALGLAALPRPALTLNPWPSSMRLPYAETHLGFRAMSYNGVARVPAWLLQPRERPRICLTLGTVVLRTGSSHVAESVIGLIEQLAGLDAEVVVAVDERIAAAWPALPPVVRHVGRVPLAPVLAACDVVVHHGGQGTALTALEAAVPQLVLPVFDDQFDNAAAVAKAGAGICLLPFEVDPRTVAACCAEILQDEHYRSAAKVVAAETAAQTPLAEVAAALAAL